jgi:hypothetical protein
VHKKNAMSLKVCLHDERLEMEDESVEMEDIFYCFFFHLASFISHLKNKVNPFLHFSFQQYTFARFLPISKPI